MKMCLYVVRRSRIELDFPGCHQPTAYVPSAAGVNCRKAEGLT